MFSLVNTTRSGSSTMPLPLLHTGSPGRCSARPSAYRYLYLHAVADVKIAFFNKRSATLTAILPCCTTSHRPKALTVPRSTYGRMTLGVLNPTIATPSRFRFSAACAAAGRALASGAMIASRSGYAFKILRRFAGIWWRRYSQTGWSQSATGDDLFRFWPSPLSPTGSGR